MSITHESCSYPEYLVETDWLEKNLNDQNLRIVDCTVNVISNPDLSLAKKFPFVYRSGRSNFDTAHIPNAGYIDVANELSDPSSKIPLTLPTEQQFMEVMSNFGVSNDSRVILYSATEQNWATRLWWLLRCFGFTNAAVLNGGWNKWKQEVRPTSTRACSYQASEFISQLNSQLLVDKEAVLSAITNENIRIINALPGPVFSGSSPISFGRKGRIKNSVNIPFMALHEQDSGSYLSVSELQQLFDSIDIKLAEKIITYCGGGIAASNNAFVLSLLGYDNVAVYDGSMLEWGNDASLPMEMD